MSRNQNDQKFYTILNSKIKGLRSQLDPNCYARLHDNYHLYLPLLPLLLVFNVRD